jgi:hypothetical protein
MKNVTLIIFALLFFACKNKTQSERAIEELGKNLPPITNMNAGKEKYTVFIPQGWTTKHTSNNGIEYYHIIAPRTKANLNTSVNIITEDMQQLSMEDFTVASMQSIRNYIPSAVIQTRGSIKANNLIGNWFTYTMEHQGLKASLVCYIFEKKGVAYIITAGTHPPLAAKYRPLFDKIASSLTFASQSN